MLKYDVSIKLKDLIKYLIFKNTLSQVKCSM